MQKWLNCLLQSRQWVTIKQARTTCELGRRQKPHQRHYGKQLTNETHRRTYGHQGNKQEVIHSFLIVEAGQRSSLVLSSIPRTAYQSHFLQDLDKFNPVLPLLFIRFLSLSLSVRSSAFSPPTSYMSNILPSLSPHYCKGNMQEVFLLPMSGGI